MSNQLRTQRKPDVVFGPRLHRELLQGSEQITAAIRPTLGPSPRLTLIEKADALKTPELLNSGGLIARRIIQIPARTQDVGAMMLRHTLWQMNNLVGDGTATAAVIFQALMQEGSRYLTAGGNAMTLRPHLEAAMKLALSELERIARPIQGKAQLERLSNTICPDAELAKALSEILDVVGAYGILEFRRAQGRKLRIEYRDGRYWENSGLLSDSMINDIPMQRAQAEDVFVLVSDLELDKVENALPIFSAALQAGAERLILIAKNIAAPALGLLMMPQNRGRLEVFTAKTPGISLETQIEAIEDLQIITGARPLLNATGDTWQSLTPERLGKARRAWISKHHLGLVGGTADPLLLRSHLLTLHKKYVLADKATDKNALQARIGRLQGGSAMIHISGATESEIETRSELARQTAQTLRSTLRDGVVPGGGSALLACCPLLEERARQAEDPEQRAAFRIVSFALQQPLNVIAANSGNADDSGLRQVRRAVLDDRDALLSFDALVRKAVDPFESGLLDSAGVTQAAVRSAISSAALTLTTEVVIHRKNPPETLET